MSTINPTHLSLPALQYAGYSTIGTNTESLSGNATKIKQITLAAGGILTHTEVYLAGSSSGTSVGFIPGVWTDNAGVPLTLLTLGIVPNAIITTNGSFRWVSSPVGIYLAAGTYWLGFVNNGFAMKVKYDDGGSDITTTGATANRLYDADKYTQVVSSKNYSIRAGFIVC